MTVGVLCAIRGPGESGIVAALDSLGPTLRVVRRCADVAELLAAAAAGLGRLVVLSADLPELDRETVYRFGVAGAVVLAITDPRSDWQAERMRALGVTRVLSGDATPAEIADAAVALVGSGTVPVVEPPEGELVPPAAGGPTRLGTAPGRLVAVWGPVGAPGRSMVALNLAAELAGASGGTLLVDADTYGSSLAMALGLLDESAGIAAVTRLACNGALVPDLLMRHASEVGGDLHVLTGLNRPERWPELASSALDLLWDVSRRAAPWVVADCGFCVESDGGADHVGMPARRNAATLGALRAADVVVVVGSADPIGIARLVRTLAELRDRDLLRPGTQPVIVVNRVRASVAGSRPNDAVREALARFAGVDDPFLVPEDRPACDGALLAGKTLREHAPASAVRRAVAALAVQLATGPACQGASQLAPARRRRARVPIGR